MRTWADDECGPENKWTEDGECDEAAGLCAAGTDTVDCASDATQTAQCGKDDEWAGDGQCDVPYYCAAGTDDEDCAGDAQCGPDDEWAGDGHCDVPDYCLAGTDDEDCAGGGDSVHVQDVCQVAGCSFGCLESDGSCDSHSSEVEDIEWDDVSHANGAVLTWCANGRISLALPERC